MNVDLIRKQLLDRRRSFSSEQLANLSLTICARFLSHPNIQSLKNLNLSVGLYRGLPGELNLILLDEKLREIGCRIFYPRILDQKSKALEFVEVSSSAMGDSSLWKKGSYGIEEPHPDLKAQSAENLDLIVVPGVGFGEQGERIGMGAGYYDRFLPNAIRALRVALAFDFQVLPTLPQIKTDQKVHWIVTESREFRTSQVSIWGSQKSGL